MCRPLLMRSRGGLGRPLKNSQWLLGGGQPLRWESKGSTVQKQAYKAPSPGAKDQA